MMMGNTIRVTVYSYTYYVWREMHPSQTDSDVGICEAFCSAVLVLCRGVCLSVCMLYA